LTCWDVAMDGVQGLFEELVSKLPEADPCFAVFDFTDNTRDGRIVKKLLLIKWYAASVWLLRFHW
jgi:Cofilin/tropomyosin-type actin-binding protein